ncbi:MAG: tyrosine-type recombinase/integrase [Gemmatimonadales bacterium]|jgi:integrase|nr:tyrosine-type recombinase/integrase [Gemmatimonadales bacterium]
MKPLDRALHDYLATRRALGFKLRRAGLLLPDFVRFLAQTGHAVVTAGAAVAWARQPTAARPAWWSARLDEVRGFAKYLQTLDSRHEIPPRALLAHRHMRAAPYVYEPTEIAALLRATEVLTSPLRVATYRTLIGLLAVTGLRTGEAIRLDRTDVDLRRGRLLIRHTKFGKTRQVPLHATTVAALARYARLRDRLAPRRRMPSFFVSTVGRRLIYQNVHETFLRLVYAAGIADRRPRRPRIHDLRHTFAVHSVVGWHRAGLDVERQLPVLATYLGHVSVASTYWYLSAVPELLGAATARLERALMDARS